ncbi:hypothetical protein CRG98_017656, partial [Punica granatum]
RANLVYGCCCSWREEFGIPDFRENSCSLWWDSLHCFRNSVLPLIGQVIGCIILHSGSKAGNKRKKINCTMDL